MDWKAPSGLSNCLLEGLPARPRRAQSIGGGDAHVLEVDAVLRVGGKTVLLAELDAGPARVHEQEIDVALTGARSRQNQQPRGGAREGHVPLGAGQDPTLAVGTRVQRDAARSEAALGLEPGRCQDRLPGGDAGQPLLLLLFAASTQDRSRTEHRAHEVGRG
jgi:hypothetical protein